jgi:hypothetical protein
MKRHRIKISFAYLENRKTCGKIILAENEFHFSLQLLFMTFFISINIYRIMLKMRPETHVDLYEMCPLLLYDCKKNLYVSSITSFMKNHPAVFELLQAEYRQTRRS